VRMRGTCVCVLLSLLAAAGCSRQPGFAPDAKLSPAQSLPFEKVSDKNGVHPTSFPPAGIPAGTTIAIRIQSSISSSTAHAGDTFRAVLDQPLALQGQVLVPSETPLAGKILAARAARVGLEPGYLRCTLTAILLGGKLVPLETSNVFLKGIVPAAHNFMLATNSTAPRTEAAPLPDARIAAERRLDFRLTRDLPVKN
jgi:hypothetical protein